MAQGHPALSILKGIFTDIPRFAALVDRIGADTISLKNKIDICIRPASWRTVRGLTAVAVIAEECGVWLPEDGGNKNPDRQILNAARPALATTKGSLYVLATPLFKRGEVWKTFERHHGPKGNPKILVANPPTRTFNPVLDEAIIDQAYEEDPVSAACEWGGMFRDDASARPLKIDHARRLGCVHCVNKRWRVTFHASRINRHRADRHLDPARINT